MNTARRASLPQDDRLLIAPPVRHALDGGEPVIALESTPCPKSTAVPEARVEAALARALTDARIRRV